MFAGYRDEVDEPTAADEGVFIPQKQLETWWKTLQKKFPAIYPPSEPCPTQHAAGVRLMCYQDDDPRKPVRIVICGSRWRKDKLMGKQAVYVIKRAQAIDTNANADTPASPHAINKTDGIYETTEFTSAHEDDPEIGWCLGWDCPPPPMPEPRQKRSHSEYYDDDDDGDDGEDGDDNDNEDGNGDGDDNHNNYSDKRSRKS